MNELNQALRKVDTQLGALELELDERLRLVLVLRLEPSANDNLDIISHVSRLAKQLSLLHEILVNGTIDISAVSTAYNPIHISTFLNMPYTLTHFQRLPQY